VGYRLNYLRVIMREGEGTRAGKEQDFKGGIYGEVCDMM
jgi:hypothetical protein